MKETDHTGATRRREDGRLLTGAGTFAADLAVERMIHATFVRAQSPSGRIRSIDIAAALAAPGVVGVFTAEDLDADGIADLEAEVDPPRDDGGTTAAPPKPFLCRDAFHCLGEPLAVVVAESPEAAVDAAELVEVDYEELPFVADMTSALDTSAPTVWDGAANNVAFVRRLGAADEVDTAIAGATHVVRQDFVVTRVTAAPMETRAALGLVDEAGRLVLHTSTQNPFAVRNKLAADVFKVDPSQVRVLAHDVGGSFGMKGGLFREDALVLWAARRCGRPVRWVSDRSESFLTDEHGRDMEGSAELALDSEGNFLALRVTARVNIGCYFSRRSMGPVNNIGGVAGTYRTPLISAQITGVFTNTNVTAPYRGAGRPEATYAIERVIDRAAAELGIDPFELRRRNLIPREAMPFQTGLIFKYDCGDFAATMARAAELIDLGGLPARKQAARARGRLLGLGIANPIEVAAGPLRAPRKDDAWIGVAPDGAIELRSGTMSVGQGHETGLARLVADRLGVPLEAIRYRQGDTDLLPAGRGNGGSGGLVVGGSAVARAIDGLIERGREAAAEILEAAAADVRFEHGRYRVAGTDLAIGLAELAGRIAERGQDFTAAGEFLPERVTYPNGCHICEVEIDPETGRVQPVRYVGVEDVGTVLNPVLVKGQMQGGIAQGIGQALGEAIIHDPESGQMVSGSFMDYRMPIAGDMPDLTLDTIEVPTAVNPLGVKGVGEAGTVGALAATMNAICDALSPLGVRHLDMPATPLRVWQAIRDASA